MSKNHLDFGLPWFRLPSGLALNIALCAQSQAQSIVLHVADDIWAVELPIEFKIVPSFDTPFFDQISCGEPSFQRCVIVFLPFISAPTFSCRTAEPVVSRSCRSLTLSDVPGEMTAYVFAGCRGTYLQFGFFIASSTLRRFSVSQELPNTQIH
jgi:hypothetical protein